MKPTHRTDTVNVKGGGQRISGGRKLEQGQRVRAKAKMTRVMVFAGAWMIVDQPATGMALALDAG